MKRESIIHETRPSRTARSTAFTLVEMLTVMAVIAILFAVGLPGFTGLNSTGLRRAAVGKMMGVLDQARGIAITEGKNAYVAFASPVPQVDQAKWGRACAIYVEDGNFNLTQRTPWIYLPVGTSFKINANVNGSPSETSIMNRLQNEDSTAAPAFPVSPSGTATSAANVQLPYLKFDSTGAVDEQTPTLARILIFLGTVNSAGTEVATKHTDNTSAGQLALLDEVRINPATGRAKYIPDVSDNLATPDSTPTPTP